MCADFIQTHLSQISDNFEELMPIEHKLYLKRLKADGFEPLVVYDLGAGALNWTRYAKTLWPDAIFVAFEAMSSFEPLYEKSNIEYHIGLLSDREKKRVKFYQNEYFFHGNSYYREVDWRTFEYYDISEFIELPSQTLDAIAEKRALPWPDLIHINVQGAEKDVLEGAKQCISHCERLIVNMHHDESKLGAPRMHKTLPYICSLGWKCDAPCFSEHGSDADYGFSRR